MRVVYNSFNGRYSDSPRAVHEALLEQAPDAEHCWLSDPEHAATFPATVATVEIYTPEAVRALESADLVVSNSHLEMDWAKRPGATYVQTWHGTPLKRIHADVLWGPPGLLEHLSEDVDRWDVLLSPNAYSTQVLRGAFRWEGEVLETGYPRNDVLRSPGADDIRRRVRRELGVEEGQTAVLYTPTWRDDAFWEGAVDADPLALDVDAATAELGPDVVLLVRLHYKLTGRMRPRTSPRVRDVSHHADVAELYLAADAMVTDYSSTMFDFAVTGKPLVLFAYDLERYRDELRGFYFDPTADPPGPVVTTSDALVEQLRDVERGHREHAAAYARFRERFCHLDDGHATERFVDRFLRS
ncbi:CDP-glycerol glycerophosphotransferase family protein [Motilibacter sp. E257]|uniref:CDP-glycerol glycerophosphotransferase family protein n=1 Tax=Motilibacter deserti TaxID=2714956 RepID=A0ABX0GWB6_9ACTN|nr:CDP-glycerol glycerophosphotransferase family protein [Motilibacter deserti]